MNAYTLLIILILFSLSMKNAYPRGNYARVVSPGNSPSMTSPNGKPQIKKPILFGFGLDYVNYFNAPINKTENSDEPDLRTGDPEGTLVSASTSYSFFPTTQVYLLGRFLAPETFLDPKLGLSVEMPIDYRWTGTGSLTVAIPISKSSREDGKITGISFEAGPSFKNKQWAFGIAANASLYAYNEPAVVKEFVADGGAAGSTSEAVESTVVLHSHPREVGEYGSSMTGGFYLTRNFLLSETVSLTRAHYEDAITHWVTESTIAKLSYSNQEVEAFVGASLRTESHDVKLPSEPLIRVGIQYKF